MAKEEAGEHFEKTWGSHLRVTPFFSLILPA
jgi:hypothetical protein